MRVIRSGEIIEWFSCWHSWSAYVW